MGPRANKTKRKATPGRTERRNLAFRLLSHIARRDRLDVVEHLVADVDAERHTVRLALVVAGFDLRAGRQISVPPFFGELPLFGSQLQKPLQSPFPG